MTEAAPYTLAQVEQEIYQQYRFFYENAPGVYPQESGQLGALWSLHDLLVEERREEISPEEFRNEHGRGNL